MWVVHRYIGIKWLLWAAEVHKRQEFSPYDWDAPYKLWILYRWHDFDRQKILSQYNRILFLFIYSTKWKRQTSVGFELLVEAGNYAAYQRAYRNYPQMDAWQYPGAGGSPSPAELYYRQASIAALQGHTPYGIYPGAAVAAAASMSLPKPAFPMFNSPVAAAAAAANSPLNHYYQNVQRLPQHVLGRRSTSPTEPLSLKRCNSSAPVSTDECPTKNDCSSDDEEHIEV